MSDFRKNCENFLSGMCVGDGLLNGKMKRRPMELRIDKTSAPRGACYSLIITFFPESQFQASPKAAIRV